MTPTVIQAVERVDDEIVHGLAALLVDAVDSNAGISFMAGLTRDEAAAWWTKTLAARASRSVVLVARDADGIVGTVQLLPSWAPNQPHRADVAKMIVHRRARRRGIARALLTELEHRARALGFTLLLLDTVKGDAAEALYASAGWIRVGEVPNFALNPDGTPVATVFFYKQL
jgi:GNAT superfamily N-acetyltransferase